MDVNIEARLKELESLDNFISYSRDKVHSILECLKWTTDDTIKEHSLIKCTVNPRHRIAASSIDDHIETCLLHKENYDSNDEFLSEPAPNSSATIHINHHKKVEILSAVRGSSASFNPGWDGLDMDPQTSDRLLSTYKPNQRLALYNYAVKNTTGPKELPEFNILQPVSNDGIEPSEEEILNKERDAKRRRIKYKSVHTNRKNYIEIMREVINGQMELYTEWVNDNVKQKDVDSQEHINKNSQHSEKDVLNYAESVGKHSSYSCSSSAKKYNGDSHSNRHSPEYRRRSHERDNYRNGRTHDYDYKSRSSNQRYSERSKDSSRRSRSRDRYEKRRRHRSRSHSRHRYRHRR